MKKSNKIIIYIFGLLVGFLLIVFILLQYIYYNYLSIRPEYSDLSRFELNELKYKFSISIKDLNKNLKDYELLLNYVNINNINWIGLNNSGSLFLNSKDINSESINDIILDDNESLTSKFDKLGIYQINNQSVINSWFDKGIAFTKNEIRYERGKYRGYLYYEGSIPKFIKRNNANIKTEIINNNWLSFNIMYFK